MTKLLQKSFPDRQVNAPLKKYIDRGVDLAHILGILNIPCSGYFQLLKEYRDDSSLFTIAYQRRTWPWKIAPEVPVRTYSCSYILDRLRDEYRQELSVPTIIKRAKEHDFYLSKPKRKVHDRPAETISRPWKEWLFATVSPTLIARTATPSSASFSAGTRSGESIIL